MPTLAARHIAKSFGGQVVLDDVSVTVGPSARLAVVGPNGIGKSTLLRLLAGVEEPDRGSVTRTPATLNVGYLPQEPEGSAGESVLGHLARRTGVAGAEQALVAEAAALAADGGSAAAESAYAAALERFLVEVRALAALDHPNIVRVLATDFLRADPFFTMEVADGGSLGTLGSPVAVLGYTPAYPVANILLTTWGAIMVSVFTG